MKFLQDSFEKILQQVPSEFPPTEVFGRIPDGTFWESQKKCGVAELDWEEIPNKPTEESHRKLPKNLTRNS